MGLKNKEIIEKMTLEEKASLMSGDNFWNTKPIERLDIPSMMLTDGPHGLRKQGGKADHLGLNKSLPSTCYPTAATLANSWDINLINKVGKSLCTEAMAEDVSVTLGPGLNIKRNVLCGRNFEYFSEDPYLTGKLAASMIKGMEEVGGSACPKHFAVNSQETHRMVIDEIVDERALHELYLEGFRYAITEGKAKTIMTSYNKVNGTYANENKYLINDVLKGQWGFDGLVVTDWGGNNDRVEALKVGNSLEMPSTNGMTDKDIVDAVKNGSLDENILNERVDELLNIVLYTKKSLGKGKNFTDEEHHNVAVEAATKSIVLLKNDNTLPLKNKEEKIAIIGDFAKTPRYQGAGSSLINPTKVDNFVDEFSKAGYNVIGYEKGYKRLGGISNSLKNKAVELAKKADKVILYLGLDESSEAEGVDRKDILLPDNQIDLFYEIYSVNSNIIVVLSGGSPVEIPFVNIIKGLLHGYLAGQGSGEAMKKIITGEANPSGKLAESYPFTYEDVSSKNYYLVNEKTSEHRESIFLGYRYYDTAKKDVLFPFGYGLSYTSFTYNDLVVDKKKATVTITNTGEFAGEEIVQLYVKSLNSKVFRADKELKAFDKVSLEKGESRTITLNFDDHSFAYYHIGEKRWVEESGEYEILVGASSRDIRLKSQLSIQGEDVKSPYEESEVLVYKNCDIHNISRENFEYILGRKLPEANFEKGKQLGYNDMIMQAKDKGWFGKFLYSIIMLTHKFFKATKKPLLANNVFFVLELPFRGIARMSAGKMNMKQLDGFLLMINGRFFKGLSQFIKYRNKK